MATYKEDMEMNSLKALAEQYEKMIAAEARADTLSRHISEHDQQRQVLADELSEVCDVARIARVNIDEMLAEGTEA